MHHIEPKTLIAAALLSINLAISTHAAASNAITDAYQAGVRDAARVERDEVSDGLSAVNAENDKLIRHGDQQRIKVVTWKSQGAYDKFLQPYDATSGNPDYAIWVTLAPEVQSFCQDFVNQTNADAAALNQRLQQHLGLHPDWKYDLFVELWVKPDDLFRPCPDPEINDTRCNTEFGKNTPSVTGIPDYKAYFHALYTRSHRWEPGVPWTGLGYTYDWHPDTPEIGVSEFILKPGSQYEIAAAVPTLKYCQP